MRANSGRQPLNSALHDFPGRHRINASTIWEPVTALAAAAALVTGCGGQASVPLPPHSTTVHAPTASPSPADTGSARAQVIAAYTAYFPASEAAEAAAPSRAQALLAPYAAQPYLGTVLAQMASYRARYEVASGYVIPHVIRVTVHGRLATVYDCQDASRATLTNTRTGTITPPLKGSARTYLIASLVLGRDGRWRITSLAHVAVSCSPASAPPS
ncbi:MAG: hypothetical protein ACRDPD_04885 [Streptosporangiaceae bacterium]